MQQTGCYAFACGSQNRTAREGGGVVRGVKSLIVVLMRGITPPQALNTRPQEVHKGDDGMRGRRNGISSDVVTFCSGMWLFIVGSVEGS